MRHSFCAASFRNTSPRCRRSSPYSVFLRHFGMKTTWYLHSHFVWLRLSSSSIDEVSFRVLGGSRSEASSMDPLKCQTSTATPAEPGGLSLTLEEGKTAASVSRLQAASELVGGFVRSDGITVL